VDYAAQGAIPGGLKNNRDFASPDVHGEAPDLLYDPQTSGGLCITVAPQHASAFEAACPAAFRIGSVKPRGTKPIELLP
jgi:selenide,water dikinase